jgi:hypothetical protein
MVVFSTLWRDCREIEYAEKAKARLGVQQAIDFYKGPEMDKEDEPDDKGKTPKHTDQHRVFDVPLDPKNKDKSDTYEIRVKTFRTGTPEEWRCLREQVETLAMHLSHKVSDQYQDNRTSKD